MTKLIRTNKKQPEQIPQISVASQQLFIELQQLITTAKKQVNSQVNAALTQLYWQIGKQINNELLQQQRAGYGQEIVKALSKKLTDEFGKGFNYSALTRMQKFYNTFVDETKVATLSQLLSWSHIILLLPIKQLQQKLHQVMASRLDLAKDSSCQ